MKIKEIAPKRCKTIRDAEINQRKRTKTAQNEPKWIKSEFAKMAQTVYNIIKKKEDSKSMIRFLGIFKNAYSFTDTAGRQISGVKCDVSFELSGADAREGQVGSQGVTLRADPDRLRFVGKKFNDLSEVIGMPCEYQVDTTKAGKVTEDVVTKIRILEGHVDPETGEFIEE